jgi:hypothetical protein
MALEPTTGDLRRLKTEQIDWPEGGNIINPTLVTRIPLSAITRGSAGPALAQVCHRDRSAVTCDDGRDVLPGNRDHVPANDIARLN